MNEMPRADPEERRDLAREARELLSENSAFKVAAALLHKQWLGQLLNSRPDRETKDELVAQLRVLESVAQALQHLINSEAVAQQRAQNRGNNARRY
jgi:hypothetical protein